jgi:DNA repair protein RadC
MQSAESVFECKIDLVELLKFDEVGKKITTTRDAIEFVRPVLFARCPATVIIQCDADFVVTGGVHVRARLSGAPREFGRVLAEVIRGMASRYVIVLLNQPLGCPRPTEDHFETAKLIDLLSDMLGSTLVDYVCVGREGSYSFRAEGVLPKIPHLIIK